MPLHPIRQVVFGSGERYTAYSDFTTAALIASRWGDLTIALKT